MKVLFFLKGSRFIIRISLIGLLMPLSVLYAQPDSCTDQLTNNRYNLGIFGGQTIEVEFSPYNERLFLSVDAPNGLFYSDNLANNWTAPFSKDSLQMTCEGLRGWAGGCRQIVANTVGWIATRTEAKEMGAVEISYQGGDSGTFFTAFDKYIFEKLTGQSGNLINGIWLSDYYLYISFDHYIIKIDSLPLDSGKITDIFSLIPSLPSQSLVSHLAASNKSNGYPLYFLVDTSGSGDEILAHLLYQFDGISMSPVTIPPNIYYISDVFTHPGQNSGDTLFITGRTQNNADLKIYRSFDGGNSWTDISGGIMKELSDIDYSPKWKSTLSSSNGLILTAKGFISYDMGNSWQVINGMSGTQDLVAVAPDSFLNTVVNPSYLGAYISFNGEQGPYTLAQNKDLSAITIKQIAKNYHQSQVYLLTKDGYVAYTTAYGIDSINSYNKWHTSYGAFPLYDSTHAAYVQAHSIAMDPFDSSHIVVANINYDSTGFGKFMVSETGPYGFAYSNTNSLGGTAPINDIAFVTSNIVLAVSGGNKYNNNTTSDSGYIWRSTDGGHSWGVIKPTGFAFGNTIEVGYDNTDTVIYVGTGKEGEGYGYIWRSDNLGLNWIKLNTTIKHATDTILKGLLIFDIAIDPRNNDTIYVVASGGPTDKCEFVKSIDGGQSYQYLFSQFTSESAGHAFAVEIYPENPDTVFASFGEYIFCYAAITDENKVLHRGLPSEEIQDIAFGSILVGTSTGFFGFGDIDEITITTNTEIDKREQPKMKIFPNPVQSGFSIKFSVDYSAPVDVRIFDLLGHEVLKTNITILNGLAGNVIYTSHLVSGTYLLKVYDGNNIFTQHITILK